MTKAYSLAFKQKMVERLTGKNAQSPSELGREIGYPAAEPIAVAARGA